jgi:hypothetical protein
MLMQAKYYSKWPPWLSMHIVSLCESENNRPHNRGVVISYVLRRIHYVTEQLSPSAQLHSIHQGLKCPQIVKRS